MKKPTAKLLLLLPLLLPLCGEAKAAVYYFSGAGLTIQDASGSGPAMIVVSGIPSGEVVVDVDVTITNFSHAVPDDTAGVVTGPGGEFVMLFDGPGDETDVINQTWIFDDSAPLPLPLIDGLTSGT